MTKKKTSKTRELPETVCPTVEQLASLVVSLLVKEPEISKALIAKAADNVIDIWESCAEAIFYRTRLKELEWEDWFKSGETERQVAEFAKKNNIDLRRVCYHTFPGQEPTFLIPWSGATQMLFPNEGNKQATQLLVAAVKKFSRAQLTAPRDPLRMIPYPMPESQIEEGVSKELESLKKTGFTLIKIAELAHAIEQWPIREAEHIAKRDLKVKLKANGSKGGVKSGETRKKKALAKKKQAKKQAVKLTK